MPTRKPHAPTTPAAPPRKRSTPQDAVRDYQAILRTAMDGFCILDATGRLLEVNDAYCQMSGYTPAELRRITIPELDVQEGAGEVARRIADIRQAGPRRFETRHRRKDGTLFEVEVSASFLPTGGGRVACFVRDITGRKRAEIALHARAAHLESILEVTADLHRNWIRPDSWR